MGKDWQDGSFRCVSRETCGLLKCFRFAVLYLHERTIVSMAFRRHTGFKSCQGNYFSSQARRGKIHIRIGFKSLARLHMFHVKPVDF